MSLSTHVLDTARGVPAEGVPITLERQTDTGWVELTRAVTNNDGRVLDFIAASEVVEGVYRITFDTSAYFDRHGIEGFYPSVPILFQVRDASQHYHVPLLVSPFGISTYRGS